MSICQPHEKDSRLASDDARRLAEDGRSSWTGDREHQVLCERAPSEGSGLVTLEVVDNDASSRPETDAWKGPQLRRAQVTAWADAVVPTA